MKTNLPTIISIAVLGIIISFVVTNMFLSPIEDFNYKTVTNSIDANVISPDPEVFNYRALNPTVEVYVGECEEYDDFGDCLKRVDSMEDNSSDEQDAENIENSDNERNTENAENNKNSTNSSNSQENN